MMTTSLPFPRALLLLSLLLGTLGCARPPNEGIDMATPDELSADEAEDGWRLLLDPGLTQWRGFKRDTPPASWSLRDGVLAFAPGSDRGDLMTREQFGDFELRLEWRISPAGNSGVIYRVSEAGDAAWHTGPEMQVLDDDEHPDARLGVDRNRTAGALYDLVGTPAGIVRPVGEWNTARVVAAGNRLEHWLNGYKLVDVVVGSEEWNRRVAASKFRDLTGFGVQPTGHIVLQDHGDPVWYRDVRIRELD